MRRFDQFRAKRPQRNANKNIHRVLAGNFDFRGPYATAHGWPFYLIDTPKQTLSIRSTKINGKRAFIIYEKFGEMVEKQPSHQCYRENVHEVIRGLMDRDVGSDFFESANRMLGIERAVDYRPENVKLYLNGRDITPSVPTE